MTKSFIDQNMNCSSIIQVNLAIYVSSYTSIIILYIYIYIYIYACVCQRPAKMECADPRDKKHL